MRGEPQALDRSTTNAFGEYLDARAYVSSKVYCDCIVSVTLEDVRKITLCGYSGWISSWKDGGQTHRTSAEK